MPDAPLAAGSRGGNAPERGGLPDGAGSTAGTAHGTRAVDTVADTAFYTSGGLFVVCICLLFSNACSPNSWHLVFVSDQLKQCEQHEFLWWVPLALVSSAAVQIAVLLLRWQVHTDCDRHLSLSLHILAFHFVLSFASVIEFNSGEDYVTSAWALLNSMTEAKLHRYTTIQTMTDFFLLHLIMISALRIDDTACHHWSAVPATIHGGLDVCFACTAIGFAVLWIMNLNRPASVLEWCLLLLAAALQIHACERFKTAHMSRPFPGPDRTARNRVFTACLLLYVSGSAVAIVLMAPPGTQNGGFVYSGWTSGGGRCNHTAFVECAQIGFCSDSAGWERRFAEKGWNYSAYKWVGCHSPARTVRSYNIEECCRGSCWHVRPPQEEFNSYASCYFCPAAGTGGPHCFNITAAVEAACLTSSNCSDVAVGDKIPGNPEGPTMHTGIAFWVINCVWTLIVSFSFRCYVAQDRSFASRHQVRVLPVPVTAIESSA